MASAYLYGAAQGTGVSGQTKFGGKFTKRQRRERIRCTGWELIRSARILRRLQHLDGALQGRFAGSASSYPRRVEGRSQGLLPHFAARVSGSSSNSEGSSAACSGFSLPRTADGGTPARPRPQARWCLHAPVARPWRGELPVCRAMRRHVRHVATDATRGYARQDRGTRRSRRILAASLRFSSRP